MWGGTLAVCGNQSDYSHTPFRHEQCLVRCYKRNVATNRYNETVSSDSALRSGELLLRDYQEKFLNYTFNLK